MPTLEDVFGQLCAPGNPYFYPYLIRRLPRQPVPGMGTMAVGTKDGNTYQLFYDPAFVEKTSLEDLHWVIKHECLHIILEHIPRLMELEEAAASDEAKKVLRFVFNFAADASLHELLRKEHPEIGTAEEGLASKVIVVEKLQAPEGTPLKLLHEQAMEYYMSELYAAYKHMPELYEQLMQALAEEAEKMRNATHDGESCEECGKPLPEEQSGDGEDEKEQQGQNGTDGDSDDSGQQSGDSDDSGQQSGDSDDSGQQSGDSDDSRDGDGEGQGDGSEQGSDGACSSCGQPKGQPVPGAGNNPILNDMLMDAARRHMQQMLGSGKGDSTSGAGYRLKWDGKRIVGDVVDSMKKDSKMWGSIPASTRTLIEEYLQEASAPWDEVFRELVERTHQTKRKIGMSRPSKSIMALQSAYGDVFKGLLPYPGTHKDRRFTIYFIRDASGSMSNLECARVFAELVNIQDHLNDCTIHVFDADCEVLEESEQVLEVGDELDWERKTCGGTDFDAYLQFTKDRLATAPRKPDVVVIGTDGWAPEPQVTLAIPEIWVITPGGKHPDEKPGRFIVEMDPASKEDQDRYGHY